MGKKYLNTKSGTLEDSILSVWQNAAEELDPVNKKAVKKKFKNRKDKDLDNDGDVDDSDEYLHKRRKAVSKAMDEGKMSQLHQYIKDKKSADEIAKLMKLDVKTIKTLMSNYNVEGVDLTELTPDQKAKKQAYQKKHKIGKKAGGKGALDPTAPHNVRTTQIARDDEVRSQGPGAVGYGGDATATKARLQRAKQERERKKNAKQREKEADERKAAGFAKERERLAQKRAALNNSFESYEIGTDEYRKHTQEVTPGQEIKKYGEFKVQSMREAMHKVWGINEKKLDKEDKDVVKSNKAMTGGKVAKVDMKPSIEDK